jgi:hypothetical protein
MCANTDLFLNLSGGSWFWRDEYAAIPHTAFIDTDPAFTQLAIANGPDWYVEFFRRFDTRFTFGANIGTPASPVDTGDLRWDHTWQPITLDEWRPTQRRARPCLTTVMTWEIESFRDIGGNKNAEFGMIADLPKQVDIPLELAINAPPQTLDELRARGWQVRDAFAVSHNTEVYRDYLASAAGEFSVAKSTYVRTASGWFSDRTACFLALGRPAIVEETGWSGHVPAGEGLFAFRDSDEARTAIECLLADPGRHARAATELARAHFAHDVVLPPLVERAVSKPAKAHR